jgi:hypothetical protein
MRPCTHFVGFRDDRYWNAVRVWGRPDFIHPGWDLRAQREIADCDTVIFAKGEHDQQPHAMSFSDIREEEPDAEAELIAD